jgi:hypothetical protein
VVRLDVLRIGCEAAPKVATRGKSGRISGTGFVDERAGWRCCVREDGPVSKTVAVEFRGRSFWAFDVSLSILLHETVLIGARTTDGDWLAPVLAELRHAAIRGSTGMLDLDLGLTDEQRQVVVRLIEQAGERLSQRELITASEAAQLEIEPSVRVLWRPADAVPTEPILDLSKALAALVRGTLPHAPAGHWWFIGLDSDWQIIGMRDDAGR